MIPEPTPPPRVAAAQHVPEGLRQLMPIKGAAAAAKVGNEKVLYVQGIPPQMRCHTAARYVLHAAQDGGFGIICILKGPNHKHEFKVLEFVSQVKRWSGPSMIGLTKLRDDCWLDERKKIWVVGAKPNPDATISMP
jgi:hypothetical protein